MDTADTLITGKKDLVLQIDNQDVRDIKQSFLDSGITDLLGTGVVDILDSAINAGEDVVSQAENVEDTVVYYNSLR